MITVEFITALFSEVDEQLRAIPKHPEAQRGLPASYPVPFWLQRVSLFRWSTITMAPPRLRLRCP